jgi:hypothetical protein
LKVATGTGARSVTGVLVKDDHIVISKRPMELSLVGQIEKAHHSSNSQR